MTAGGFMWAWTDPFYWSPETIASLAVPAEWDVGLNGYGYMIDWADEALVGPASIPLMRNQLDSSARPGEAALSRENLWRRMFTSFHHGAGQRWSDRDQSDQNRFRQSKGVDPWTRDRLTLLHDATQRVSSSTITEIVPANTNAAILYYLDATVAKGVYFNADGTVNGPFSGAVTLLPGNHPGRFNGLASDGSYIYVITGVSNPDSVWRITSSNLIAGSFATAFGGAVLDSIGVAHGRVMVGAYFGGAKIYDATTGTPALVGTLKDLGEAVAGFAEGTKVIYAVGRSPTGKQSRIYSITYDPTTATLGTPTVAGLIPMGEVPQVAFGYLGFVFVGTDKGFRMCRQTVSDGSLEVGPLVPVTGGVSSFTAIAQYVYFTWPNFDGASAGIGRIDISTFTDADLVPAYASDLMAPVAGTVPSVTLLDTSDPSAPGPRPYFVVNGSGGGIYQQSSTDYVASGTMDLGLTAYGISEDKDIHAVDVRTEPLVGSVTVALAADEATPGTLDTVSQAGSSGAFMPALHVPASRAEVRLTLTRGAVTQTPAVTAVTMYAWPAVHRGEMWVIPILLHEEIGNRFRPFPMQIWTELARIRSWTIPGTEPVLLQIGDQTMLVKLIDYAPRPLKRTQDGSAFQCTVQLQIKDLDRKVAA